MRVTTKVLEWINARVPPDSLRARMAAGTFWLASGSVAFQGSAMVSGILCARFLGQTGFGELSLLRSTVLMFGVLAGTGFGVLAIKYVSEHWESSPQYAGELLGLLLKVSLTTGLLVTIPCFLLASPITLLAMKSGGLALALRLGSFLLLFNSISGVTMGAISGFEGFRSVFKINALDALLNLVLVSAGAYTFGVNGAIGGSVMAAGLSLPVKYRVLISHCRRLGVSVTFRSRPGDLAEVIKTMLPIVVLGFAFYPFEWIARLLLVRQSNGYAELGLFTAANSFAAIVSFIPNQLLSPVQALLGNLLGKQQLDSFRRLALFSVLLSGGVAVLATLVIVILAKYLMRAYGASFTGASNVLIILCIANIFFALAIPYYKILIAYNRIWLQAFCIALLGLVLIVAMIALQQLRGMGLSLSYLAAYLVLFAIQTKVIFRIITKRESGPSKRSPKSDNHCHA